MLNTLANYDIGFAFYQNNNLNQYYCAPNKVYDYIVTGLPVITNSYPGLLDVVEKNGIGICLETVNSKTIATAIKKIITLDLIDSISRDIKERYTWENQEDIYLAIFNMHPKNTGFIDA
jgi:glycosyltransferase involved in cell wall biosynthesis